MITRFKFLAVALGLVVATGAYAGASAKTMDKTVAKSVVARHLPTHRVVRTTVRAPSRLHVGTRVVKHVRIVRRAPLAAKRVGTTFVSRHAVLASPLRRIHAGTRIAKGVRVVKAQATKTRLNTHVVSKTVIHTGKASLQLHAMNHRVAKTIVR